MEVAPAEPDGPEVGFEYPKRVSGEHALEAFLGDGEYKLRWICRCCGLNRRVG